MSDIPHNEVALALCDACKGQGRCMLGYKASWRYYSTRPDPVTLYGRTKMDMLTQPMAENNHRPVVQAFGEADGARFIVGASMCAYVRSLKIPPRKKMSQKAKARRDLTTQKNLLTKLSLATPSAALVPPSPPVSNPAAMHMPPIPPLPQP